MLFLFIIFFTSFCNNIITFLNGKKKRCLCRKKRKNIKTEGGLKKVDFGEDEEV